MSSHCSRYPGCCCGKDIGSKCHLPDGHPHLGISIGDEPKMPEVSPKILAVDPKLLLQKIIYAKSIKMTRQQVLDVLNLEIETHLNNNPEVQFAGVGEVKENADRSKTYNLLFKYKS